MIKCFFILLFACASINIQAQVNIIRTICGDGTAGYAGDGKSGNDVMLNDPDGICMDKYGNLYVSDALNSRIRKINLLSGIVTTIAGNGSVDFSGDGGPATNAALYIPQDVAIDSFGNVFIVDAGNNRIRKISATTSIITTVAGSGPSGIGVGGSSGDGGIATNAQLNNPFGLCLDQVGNIYIADYNNNKIRKVDANTNIITTIAGNGVSGYSGDAGQATASLVNKPSQIYADKHGNILFSQSYNNVIRKVDISTGVITTIAGNGMQGYSGDNDLATKAKLYGPIGVSTDDEENIYIADWGNGVIRKIDHSTNIITTVAGNGIKGYSGDGGPATNAQLIPEDMCLDKHGRMYVADYDNNRIRMVYDSSQHYTEVSKVARNNIKVYPNPASNELVAEGAEGSEATVYNMVGQSFDKVRMTTNSEKINVAKLPSGMYLINIINQEGDKIVRKFVKE